MITKQMLEDAVLTAKTDTKNALQTVYDVLNNGQKKQLIKNEQVVILFDLYNVEYDT